MSFFISLNEKCRLKNLSQQRETIICRGDFSVESSKTTKNICEGQLWVTTHFLKDPRQFLGKHYRKDDDNYGSNVLFILIPCNNAI